MIRWVCHDPSYGHRGSAGAPRDLTRRVISDGHIRRLAAGRPLAGAGDVVSIDYYDRSGKPITLDEWARMFRDDKVVAKTAVPEADAEVSTVWLGADHGWGDGPPLIFETMVFGSGLDQICERYSTEAQAIEGHERMVARVKAEAVAFAALTDDAAVIDAVRLVQSRLAAHRELHSYEDYTVGGDWARLVAAIAP